MSGIDRRTFSFGAGAALAACVSPPPPPQATLWRALPAEPYRGKQDDIVFVSRDAGWYGNGAGKLFRTTNGGEAWEKIWEQPGTFIRALGFLDERNGFLGNVGMNYFPNVTDTKPLYRTRDGGATWTPIQTDGVGAVAGICGIDIARHQGMTIVTAAGRVGGPAKLMRSLDSGESWRIIDLAPHAGMILDVKFFDVLTGFVCAATSSDMAQANAAILRTTDGGETWSRVYQSNRPFENCWKMSWPTRRTGYASIQNYQDGFAQRFVAKTTDGGATWRELPLVEDTAVREFGVGFVDENWGWVGANTTGFETRDGGESWSPLDMGRAVNKIRVLRDGRSVRAYAIGAEVRRFDTAV